MQGKLNEVIYKFCERFFKVIYKIRKVKNMQVYASKLYKTSPIPQIAKVVLYNLECVRMRKDLIKIDNSDFLI